MAKAKQCDICKDLYIDNEETDAYSLLDAQHFVYFTKPKLPLTNFVLESNGIKKEYDTCDKCAEKIINFINTLITKKEICN